jgi:hypothetical protein
MKKPFLLAALGLLSYQAYALPDYDPIANATGSGGTSYAPGANLAGQTDAQGQSWYQTATSGTQPTISATTLTYTGGDATLVNSGGGSIKYGPPGSGASVDRLNLSSIVYSGTLYYSFLIDVTSTSGVSADTGNGALFVGFNNGQGSSSTAASQFVSELRIGTVSGGFALGVSNNGPGTGQTAWTTGSGSALTVNTTYLVVESYTFDPIGLIGTSSLWVNPEIATSSMNNAAPTPSAFETVGAQYINSGQTTNQPIASLAIGDRIASEGAGLIGEVRVGANWSDVVVVVPEPSALALVGLGLAGLVGFCRARRR